MFFTVFFAMLGLALVCYVIMSLREYLKGEETIPCVLEVRKREKFPHQTIAGRRDRVDYTFIFRTETGKRITTEVRHDVYKSVPKEVEGILVHRGSRFISFTFGDTTITADHTRSED